MPSFAILTAMKLKYGLSENLEREKAQFRRSSHLPSVFSRRTMDPITLAALADFPDQLEAYYSVVPSAYKNWRPQSWDGVPSEPFTPIEQVCHVKDIEIDGYHVRFRRTLEESNPVLASLDGELLATERSYATAETV